MKIRGLVASTMLVVCMAFAAALFSPWQASGTQLSYTPSTTCEDIINLRFGPYVFGGLTLTLDPKADNQNPFARNSNASCVILTDFQISAEVMDNGPAFPCEPCHGYDVTYSAVSGSSSRVLLHQSVTPGDPVASDHYTTGIILRAGEQLEVDIDSDGGSMDGLVVSVTGFTQ